MISQNLELAKMGLLSVILTFATASIAFIPIQARALETEYIETEQGWSPLDREKAHHENLGTELMPLDWFLALEQDDSMKKLSQQIEDFGFVKDKSSLPVGFTIDENEITGRLYGVRKWIGVNCAACHTGLVEINHQKILIEGNQSLVDLQGFEESIIKSVSSTLTDANKFKRFTESVASKDDADLRNNLQLFLSEFSSWSSRNHHYFDQSGNEIRFGPGRIDGLGGATNDFSCFMTDRLGDGLFLNNLFVNAENCRSAHAPSSIPHLWGMVYLEHTQWNGQVHASLGRNVGAMMAGFGKNWVENTWIGIPKVKTSIKIEKVAEFEDLYRKLTPPLWKNLSQKGVVPSIDISLLDHGRKLFESNCMSCHSTQPQSTQPNKFGNSYWKTQIFNTNQIGTDPYYTYDEYVRRPVVNVLSIPIYNFAFGLGAVALDQTVPAASARGLLPGLAILNFFVENGVKSDGRDQLQNCREGLRPQLVQGIKSRSLDGIAFTAPFLHNGSVPTLWDLLSSENERPKTFWLGCRKFDTTKLGYDCEANSSGVFQFDTSLRGNSNRGHQYGTNLTRDEKFALIEYIKMLEQPAKPMQNSDCH